MLYYTFKELIKFSPFCKKNLKTLWTFDLLML